MRQENHDLQIRGIPKMKSQGSAASDPETLQSQTRPSAQKRLSLNGLEIAHGRQDITCRMRQRTHRLAGFSIAQHRRPPREVDFRALQPNDLTRSPAGHGYEAGNSS